MIKLNEFADNSTTKPSGDELYETLDTHETGYVENTSISMQENPAYEICRAKPTTWIVTADKDQHNK